MTSEDEGLVIPQIGQQAPDFEADLYPQGKFRLSDLRTKKNLILAFYPKNNTPGCTREICAFNADLARFRAADTELVGISCDSLDSHADFSRRHELQIELISDSNKEIGRLYGSLRPGYENAERRLFVIDKSGVIRHIHDGMPVNEDLLAVIRGL